MRNTKLVLIEGFPGSGKSTTARYLAARLEAGGLAVSRYLEDQLDHPLNVGGPLHPSGKTTGEAFFARYTVDSCIGESLERWRDFVTSAEGSPSVRVVESYPIQSSVRLLCQLDADPSRIRDYARQVNELIAPLAPVLVYLDSRDAIETLQTVGLVRGEAWMAYAIAVMTNCPYAWNRHLSGLEGAVEMVRAYQHVVEELLAESPLPRLVLSNCRGQWDSCYERILTFLEYDK
jgi:hypothetical protein